jgi:predicted amidophosphoribosyltransferase
MTATTTPILCLECSYPLDSENCANCGKDAYYTREMWVNCAWCTQERRVVDNRMVSHRRWDGREMITCDGSGQKA